MMIYSDESRENDKWSLPDVEVFYVDAGEFEWKEPNDEGWYYWYCFPGCLPDSDPVGPFETEAEAINDAKENA